MSVRSGRIWSVLLSEVVDASAAVARSPARLDKIGEIARLLVRVPVDEVPIAVAFLSGELTQRQIGVGYAALFATEVAGAWGGDGGLAQAGQDGPAPADHGKSAPAGQGKGMSAAHGGPPPGSLGEPALAGQTPVARPSLTLTETDAALAAIGALAGPGSQAQRRRLLADLLGRATEGERQFLVRLMAGDLRQGALEGVMTEAVAKAAGVPAAEVRRAHQLRGSLSDVARTALAAAADARRPDADRPHTGGPHAGGPQILEPSTAGPDTGERDAVTAALRAFTLRVGQPVRPMLAASAPNLDAALDRIWPAALEWKVDGIRIQIHRSGGQVRVFTRTLDDITARVPELVALAGDLTAGTAVIDGEAVALRPDGRPHPFQVTSARMASQSDASVPLTAFLFDLLHVDGEDLIDRPADERFGRLAAIVPGGVLIPRLVTADRAEAAEFFDTALARGHEGVVVKSLQAPYRAGRRGGEWIKVKPRTTLDLVILAAEWGHGRRSGLLSNLHLGARDPRTGGFVMLGKTFKGLTDAMLSWQTERLLGLADPPGSGGSGERRYGVVRVRPELVAEIAFDGVQESRRYPGGVTLRFARVLRYREDKRADEADTIDAVRALWPHGQG